MKENVKAGGEDGFDPFGYSAVKAGGEDGFDPSGYSVVKAGGGDGFDPFGYSVVKAGGGNGFDPFGYSQQSWRTEDARGEAAEDRSESVGAGRAC